MPRHGIGDGTRQHKVAFTVRICQLESTIPPIKGTKRTLSLQLYCMLHYVVCLISYCVPTLTSSAEEDKLYGDLGNAIRSISVNEELQYCPNSAPCWSQVLPIVYLLMAICHGLMVSETHSSKRSPNRVFWRHASLTLGPAGPDFEQEEALWMQMPMKLTTFLRYCL